MAIIKKPTEAIQVNSMVALLYGQPGIGKTTWALTAPAPLLLDFDNGIRRVRPEDRKDYVPIGKWEDAIDVINSPELDNYQTIVIDTAGMALDFLVQVVIGENPKLGIGGDLTLKGWGALKAKFRNFVGLLKAKGKFIVFVAHDKEQTENEQKYVRPDISGASLSLIVRESDLVGYMEAQGTQRTISFTPTQRSYGKNSMGLPGIMELKNYKLEDVFQMYQKQQESQAEMLAEYNVLKSEIEAEISKINDEDSARDASTVIKEMPIIWDSKLYAGERFRDRLSELGLRYNKESDSYEKTV